MPNATKISVSLTPELAAVVEAAVETGEYATASEMIRETIRHWKARRDAYQEVSDRVGLLVHIGLTGGPSKFTNIEEIEEEARRQLIEEDTERLRALLDEAEQDGPCEPLDMDEIRAEAHRRWDEEQGLPPGHTAATAKRRTLAHRLQQRAERLFEQIEPAGAEA